MTKKPKRRLKFLNFTLIIFLLSILITGTCTVLLKAYSNSLVERTQRAEAEIKEYELMNEALLQDIAEIDTNNQLNMDDIIAQTHLDRNNDNIVQISRLNP